MGLNPCFNGRYSQSGISLAQLIEEKVLILVLMEDTLREIIFCTILVLNLVLILVLMEDTLRVLVLVLLQVLCLCLNPCFNGRYSQRRQRSNCRGLFQAVLILVLMEDTLRDSSKS